MADKASTSLLQSEYIAYIPTYRRQVYCIHPSGTAQIKRRDPSLPDRQRQTELSVRIEHWRNFK